MTMTEHTPGPWVIEPAEHKGSIVYDLNGVNPSTAIAAVWKEGDAHLIAKAPEMAEHIRDLQALTDSQAEDEGLWFIAKTAPEAYLQQELRKLHAVIESFDNDKP